MPNQCTQQQYGRLTVFRPIIELQVVNGAIPKAEIVRVLNLNATALRQMLKTCTVEHFQRQYARYKSKKYIPIILVQSFLCHYYEAYHYQFIFECSQPAQSYYTSLLQGESH